MRLSQEEYKNIKEKILTELRKAGYEGRGLSEIAKEINATSYSVKKALTTLYRDGLVEKKNTKWYIINFKIEKEDMEFINTHKRLIEEILSTEGIISEEGTHQQKEVYTYLLTKGYIKRITKDEYCVTTLGKVWLYIEKHPETTWSEARKNINADGLHIEKCIEQLYRRGDLKKSKRGYITN
mgnify:CR=1 FL=1